MKENFHHRLFVLKKYENCLFICNYTCILLLLKVFYQGNEYEMPQGHKMPQGYEMPQGYMEGMCFRKKKKIMSQVLYIFFNSTCYLLQMKVSIISPDRYIYTF